MTDDKQLDHLIGVLYETVVDPSLWPEAIELCARYAGGVDGHLMTIEKVSLNPTAFIASVSTFSLAAATDYADYYVAIDPRHQILVDAPIHQWLCCHHFHDRNFVKNNEFYQDFLIPNGPRYAMGTVIDVQDDHFSVFGSQRAVGQSPFGDNEQLAAQRFGHHLQRALRLQKHTQNLQAKAELGAIAIDALALSMLIVDSSGMILHLNAGAQCLLNSRVSVLFYKAGRLSMSDSFQRNKLGTLIKEATGSPAVGGAMLLEGAESRQLFVTPLPAASPLARDWQKPLALVLVVETGRALTPIQLLAKLYDLSPAEQRVASALLSGKSPEQYAEEACVSIFTVRTQLKSLFQKTDTSRQSELVAVLSRVPPLQS